MALEALSEYALSIPETPFSTINALFTVQGRSETEKLLLDKNEKVETDLKVNRCHKCINVSTAIIGFLLAI